MRVLTIALTSALILGAAAAPAQWGQVAAPASTADDKPKMLRVDSGILLALRLTKVDPVYPEQAKSDGIQGKVMLHVVIGTDGHVQSVEATSGPESLRPAAADAVRQWTYKPYLLNGEPVVVDTLILVTFRLEDGH